MNDMEEGIRSYYDGTVRRRLNDFINGNARVERAWGTIEAWAPTTPKHILEVGCGIGAVSWRMSRRWPSADVVGSDISPKSIEIAQSLFASSNLSFVEGLLSESLFTHRFDLIVLMDVYEHVRVQERIPLHETLRRLRRSTGRIILSFPTPRFLAWLKQNNPKEIQPVDEDISIGTIETMARDTGTEVLLYQEMSVWREGDYAHAVLARRAEWLSQKTRADLTEQRPTGFSFKRLSRATPANLVRRARSIASKWSKNVELNKRLALVRQKLGSIDLRNES